MRPNVCLYQCGGCNKIVQWLKEPMYLLHNPNSYVRNYVFLFLCEECFVDSIFSSFNLFQEIPQPAFINNQLNNIDPDLSDQEDENIEISDNESENNNTYENIEYRELLPIKKYFYIDDNLKAILTQDKIYFQNVPWTLKNECLIGHTFPNYSSVFMFFLNNFDQDTQWILDILYFILDNFKLPIIYNKMTFIDYHVSISNLPDKDISYFKSLRKYQLHLDYFVSGIYKLLPDDLFNLLLQF